MRKIKTTASQTNASLFTFPSRTKLKANTHPGIVVLLARAKKKKKDLHYEFQCIFSDTGFKQINKHKPPVTAYVLIMKGAQMRKE